MGELEEDEIKQIFEEVTGDIVHEITIREGPRGPDSYQKYYTFKSSFYGVVDLFRRPVGSSLDFFLLTVAPFCSSVIVLSFVLSVSLQIHIIHISCE